MEVIAQIFNEVMDPSREPPNKWRKTELKVLFKKGDALDPANYRPIASLPILYKLFTRCLCGRIGPTLDSQQSEDQAGFRKHFSCDDHLFVIRQLSEKAAEFCLPLWVVAIDFQKAFDSFSHTPPNGCQLFTSMLYNVSTRARQVPRLPESPAENSIFCVVVAKGTQSVPYYSMPY